MQRDEQTDGVSVHAGFPNPAADKALSGLDLNRLLIQHTASTFLFSLRGNDWKAFGIFDEDIAIVDRALDARKNDLVIWWSEDTDGFAISNYKDVRPGADVWGVVTNVIHQFRKQGT
jgi:SOS-response transcriptional repressor LexA